LDKFPVSPKYLCGLALLETFAGWMWLAEKKGKEKEKIKLIAIFFQICTMTLDIHTA